MSVRVVSNASPLIYLSKLGKLKLLQKLFKEILIPKEVFNEVVLRGKEGKFSGVLVIEDAVRRGWLKTKGTKVDRRLLKFAPELDLGETEVISLAREIKADLVLMDDASARSISESFGLDTKGTIYVLLKAYKSELITKEEIKTLLDKLILTGFRLSSEVYSRILKEL
jgi:predicted nucleic acid-binding protein